MSVSQVAMIEALMPGQSCVPKVIRYDSDLVKKKTLIEVAEQMRNTLMPAVSRIQKDLKRRYMIEKIETRTHSMDIVIAMCVTRTK